MNNLPSWIPNIRSWVNAIAIILLVMGLQRLLIYLWMLLFFLVPHFHWVDNLFGLLALLSPIVAIAFLHHWLHKFLNNTFPDSTVSIDDEVSGILPGLFSWWQGLYGWMVNTLSAYIIFFIWAIFLPAIYLLNLPLASSQIRSMNLVSVWIIIAQIVIAAFLYQVEYLVQKRLIAEGRN